METDRSDEEATNGIPYDCGCRVPVRLSEGDRWPLHVFADTIGDTSQRPARARVGGVVESGETDILRRRVYKCAFIGLRDGSHHKLRVDGAPREAGEPFAHK